jgi:hypothetical protein
MDRYSISSLQTIQLNLKMEIRLDVRSLPMDGQIVRFKLQNGEWKTGEYTMGDSYFWVDEKEKYSAWDVSEWEPKAI